MVFCNDNNNDSDNDDNDDVIVIVYSLVATVTGQVCSAVYRSVRPVV